MSRPFGALFLLLLLSLSEACFAQTPAPDLRIVWEVKNRFRLFRMERDFLRHVAAHGDGVLGAERRLAHATDGRGWARLMLNSLCVDAAGSVLQTCERDGVAESYVAPKEHAIGVVVSGAPAAATCAWSFESADHVPQQVSVPCGEEVRLRAPYGTPTLAAVDVALPDGQSQRLTAEILVRDVLVAGIGDSVASGEGNPDRAIMLDDRGFCFRRALGSAHAQYFRPGRAGFRGNKSCESTAADTKAAREWQQHGANWMSAACHRSLYGYQLRAALALAVENPQLAVTFIPLACTGADIANGVLGPRRAREVSCGGRGRSGPCPSTVPAQIAQMRAVLEAARTGGIARTFDLVFLTVGANDIRFSELVANVLLERSTERLLLESAGAIATIPEARRILETRLPTAFSNLRAALKPLVGGALSRVVYVSYGNPALKAENTACGGGRGGVDVHPAFNLDEERLRESVNFVETEFLPAIRALAVCEDGALCSTAEDAMTFVDGHQSAFASRGFCVRSDDDPAFDRNCFARDGESFHRSPVEGARQPLVCGRSAREFRPYAARARWIRTPNDSYFTAMTYPDGLPTTMQPVDIHDATWGVLSAVYGGAIHPTAEGHAAMADAALPAARRVLHLEHVERPVGRDLPPAN